jgi:hypothetical protein
MECVKDVGEITVRPYVSGVTAIGVSIGSPLCSPSPTTLRLFIEAPLFDRPFGLVFRQALTQSQISYLVPQIDWVLTFS